MGGGGIAAVSEPLLVSVPFFDPLVVVGDVVLVGSELCDELGMGMPPLGRLGLLELELELELQLELELELELELGDGSGTDGVEVDVEVLVEQH